MKSPVAHSNTTSPYNVKPVSQCKHNDDLLVTKAGRGSPACWMCCLQWGDIFYSLFFLIREWNHGFLTAVDSTQRDGRLKGEVPSKCCFTWRGNLKSCSLMSSLHVTTAAKEIISGHKNKHRTCHLTGCDWFQCAWHIHSVACKSIHETRNHKI